MTERISLVAPLMAETDIEYRVERDFDRLDKKFMRGELSQAEYDTAAMLIHTWSLNAYADLWRAQREAEPPLPLPELRDEIPF